MLTINDIKMNVKAVFARQEDSKRNDNLAILNYIDYLSRQTSTNIATWDLEKMFRCPDSKTKALDFIKDRRVINEIFFAEVERLRATPNANAEQIQIALKSGLDLVSAERKKLRLKELEQKIATEQSSIDRFVSDTLKTIASIATLKKEVFTLQTINMDDKIISDLQEVLSGPFYELLEVRGSTVTFATKNDIINTHVKPSANVDLRVNLGKYKILFDMNSLAMILKPHANNTIVQDKYHPFASNQGKICWGTASDTAAKFLQAFDVKNALLLLASLLSNYSEEGGPYLALGYFAEAQKAVKPAATEEVPF